MSSRQVTITIDLDGVLSRPPFGINPGEGKNKRRDRAGRLNLLWLTERFRYWGRKPMPGAAEGLRLLAARHSCAIVTARGDVAAGYTRKWVARELGVPVPVFTRPHWRETSAQFKVRLVQELGAQVHIEDDPHTARWVGELIPHVLLVDWPRNRWLEGPNIYRIETLAEAPALVDALLGN